MEPNERRPEGEAAQGRARKARARRRLRNLVVHFISLVARGANRRQIVARSAGEGGAVRKCVEIGKADAARRMVYGIVYAPDEADTEGDTMRAEDIERAAHDFLRAGRARQVDADHDGHAGRGYVAESWIVRAGDPLFPDERPGAWAVGIHVTDEATWARIERGELRALSLEGRAHAERLPEAEEVLRSAVEALGARIEALEHATAGRASLGASADGAGPGRHLPIL